MSYLGLELDQYNGYFINIVDADALVLQYQNISWHSA